MKWTLTLSLPAVVLCSTADCDAGLLERCLRHQKATGCDCAPMVCCQPAIVRPCHCNVYCYKRQQPCGKPACCDVCCAPSVQCAPEPCACPQPRVCCDAPCCELPSRDDCCCPQLCSTDRCRLAELIFQSQTACYPRQRRRALARLGNGYRCDCVPEVMDALVYSLNDADPHVRQKAADEIGDQLKKNPYCCCPKVVCALRCALTDCHRGTRREAEKALERCGFEVVECRLPGHCDMTNCCFGGAGGVPSPMMPPPAEPQTAPQEAAPVPPESAGQVSPSQPGTFLPPTLEVNPAPPVVPSVYFRTKREFQESKAHPAHAG